MKTREDQQLIPLAKDGVDLRAMVIAAPVYGIDRGGVR